MTMHDFTKRALLTAALAGGLWAAGTGVASATGTDGSDGIGSGTEAAISLSAPITIGGNAIGLLGDAETTDASTSSNTAAPSAGVSTAGLEGVLAGTAAVVAVDVPVTVAGNAVGVLGDASSDSSTATSTTAGSGGSGATTSGEDGLLSGTQALADVTAPVTIGGNAIGILADASSEHSTVASSATTAGGSDGATTSGEDGVLSGSQVVADVLAPITAGGNAVAVLGDASSEGSTTESSTAAGSDGAATSGDDGELSGSQVVADVVAPITAGGNAVAVLGDASSEGSTTESSTAAGSDGATTSGDDGVLSGSQVVADVLAPITVGGNAVAVLGDASSEGATTESGTAAGSDGATTSGEDGLLSGSIIDLDAVAPVTIGGNAIGVVGDAVSEGSTTTSETGGAADAPSSSGDDGLLSGSIIDLDVLAPVTIGGNAVGVVGDATSTGSTTTSPTVPTVPTEPTEPTVPTEPTEPTVPTEPTEPTVPTVPTEPTAPGEPTDPAPIDTGGSGDGTEVEKDPVLPGDDAVRDGGDSRADLQSSGASAAQLPRTGLDQPGILPLALAMLALGLLLVVGARRVRATR